MTLFPLENEFFAGRAPGCYNDPDFRTLEAKDPEGTLQSEPVEASPIVP